MAGFYEAFWVQWEFVEDSEAFPYNLPAVKTMDRIELHPNCTFFIGENGSGKSTVLEAIAVKAGFSAEGGSKEHQVKTHDSHTMLHETIKAKRGKDTPGDTFFLRAESFYNVATYLEEMAQWGPGPPRFEPLHKRSHGEAFLEIANGLQGHGLYLMDEPESALSPQRQLAILKRIDDLVHDGSQFIIATHSPILLAYPKARIFAFDEDGISETSYEDTDHYRITSDFLKNRNAYLRHLIRE